MKTRYFNFKPSDCVQEEEEEAPINEEDFVTLPLYVAKENAWNAREEIMERLSQTMLGAQKNCCKWSGVACIARRRRVILQITWNKIL